MLLVSLMSHHHQEQLFLDTRPIGRLLDWKAGWLNRVSSNLHITVTLPIPDEVIRLVAIDFEFEGLSVELNFCRSDPGWRGVVGVPISLGAVADY